MAPRVTIHRLTEDDAAAIAALAAVIWRACYPGIISPEQIEYMLAWMYAPETIRAEMRAGVRYEGLNVGGEPVGFAAWGPAGEPGVCKLHKLYVLPKIHGVGVGSAALSHVAAAAREAGFVDVVLAVNKRNGRAISAYSRNGFETRASVCTDIGGGFVMDDYIMGKRLT